jgi:two-component system NtrC family sensor kinase
MMAGRHTFHRSEGRYVRKDGRAIWVNLMASLVRGEDGEPLFAIAMVEDVTERKQTQDALIQAEKLALAGKLAASLAHEINNPMQSVIGCLGLAKEALAAGEGAGRYLDVAHQELRRVAQIVSQLRDLHRPAGSEEREAVDVNALLEQVLTLTRKKCEDRGVEVVWSKMAELPVLTLAADRVRQVFLNLVLNALDAMPDGGQLRVDTARTHRPPGVRVSFSDDGEGIPPQALPQIFEPFYSTKPGGLGLGLFISRGIVEQHDGHIEVDSRVGKGTTFRVWLPT